MTLRMIRRSSRLLLALSTALAALAASVCAVSPLRAQSGTPPAQPASLPPPPPLPSYRAPTITLVQPAAGATIPLDKPVVVFRFAQGEPADPLDLTSFTIAVDGHDRTALFQVSGSEAWGPLAGPSATPGEVGAPTDSTAALTSGEHQIAARICSSRGTCSSVNATVSVAPATTKPSLSASQKARRQRLLELLLAATRKILIP